MRSINEILNDLFLATAMRAAVAADGTAFTYRQIFADSIRLLSERVAVESHLLDILVKGGNVAQDGSITLFKPVIVPWSETEQLRVLFYKPRPKSQDEITRPVITARLEPIGVQDRFDVTEKSVAAEATAVAA